MGREGLEIIEVFIRQASEEDLKWFREELHKTIANIDKIRSERRG